MNGCGNTDGEGLCVTPHGTGNETYAPIVRDLIACQADTTDKGINADLLKKLVAAYAASELRLAELNELKNRFLGMAAHDMSRAALRTRASMEHLFILITMGDMLGVPILPPYYSLRLLPYVVPQISTWKRRMLREKDLTDALA